MKNKNPLLQKSFFDESKRNRWRFFYGNANQPKKGLLNVIAIFTIFLFLPGSYLQAQISAGGSPASDRYTLVKEVDTKDFPSVDLTKYLEEDAVNDARSGQPYRIAVPIAVNYNLENSGTWETLANGDRVWRLTLNSLGAKATSLVYDQFIMPKGATLFLYNRDKTHVLGAYTDFNNKANQAFATALVRGDQVTLEYFEPVNVNGEGVLSISQFGHVYRGVDYMAENNVDLGDSGPCQVNVNCPEGNNWQDEKRGVAKMFLNGIAWCTGSLINNVEQDCRPLFLTADHCLPTAIDALGNPTSPAVNWVFYWNFEYTGCANSGAVDDTQTTSGATLLANAGQEVVGAPPGDASDFALFELDENPAEVYDVYFNGFDASGATGTNGVGIHHPRGDAKKIATHTLTPASVVNNNYWRILPWAATANGQSVTEGGSSGSPLFNNGGLIIGQLFGGFQGGQPNCDDPDADEGDYGRLDVSWNFGAVAGRRLRDHLDPNNTGVTLVQGMDAMACGFCELVLDCSNIFDQDLECRSDLPPVDFDLPIVVDSCGDVTKSALTIIPGNSGCPGDPVIITREYFLNDGMNAESCMQTFTVESTIPPTVNCPANVTRNCDQDTSPASTGTATGSASCSNFSVSISHSDVTTQGQGCSAYSYIIIRTWAATDNCGRTSTCTQTITVQDLVAPMITCPANVTVECDQPTDPGATGNAVASNDNCAPNNELTVSFSDVSTQVPTGCGNDMYTITRTWTVSDPCGNTSTCVQTIEVVDTTPPTIVCPANTTIECDEDTSPANTGTAVAVDACAPEDEISITFSDVSTQAASGCGQYQYTINRTWTATDPCGNASTCLQIIEVEDTTPPVITCPADVTIECDEDTSPAMNGTATATDNCSAVNEIVISFTDVSTQTPEGCGQFQYVIYRTWQAADACDNTSTCVQTINVEDTTPPVITCPPSQTLTCFETVPPPHMNAADYIAAGGTISDNCTIALSDFSVFNQDDDNGGDNCPGNARVVVRTYFVADACGNTTTCTQTFTYLPSTQGPVITSVLPTCYKYCASLANPMESDITYDTDCSFGATINITGPTQIGADNCPGTIYRYTYSVTDDCGRTSAPVTRDFIIGNDGPTIECPAFNLLLECGDPNNSDYIDAHVGLVTANSSCELGYNITYSPQNFNNITCNSTTVVTFRVTDDCGRTATCTSTINISDNTAPEITSVYVDGICNEAVCGSNLNFWYNEWKDKVLEGLSATDACDSNVSFSTNGPNSPLQNCPDETTETVVEFVASDNCGNTSYLEYSFYVTALDTPEPPPTSSISGMVRTEDMDAVEDVEVNLTGGAGFFEQFVTGNDGSYEFNDLLIDQNYQINPYHNQFPMNGVSSFDLILIAQHVLDIQALDSPYKMIAADVNRSGSITTFDLLELRKMILFVNADFPNNTSWRFVDANFVFPYADNPFATAFPEIVDINSLLEAVEHDFVGVKIGDVNGSAVPNNLSGADGRSFNGDLNFNIKDKVMKAGETYEVAFSSNDFKSIAGYQYTLNFDTRQLEFIDVASGELTGMSANNFGLSLIGAGAITTSWTHDAPVTMKEDADLFRITFKAKETITLSEALSVSSRFTTAEAYDVNTENGQLNLLNVGLRFDDAVGEQRPFTLLQNVPNPFVDETAIGFILPEASAATLTVYDITGRVLMTVEGNYEAGYSEVSLERSGLAAGMLYYRLETESRHATKKMMLIKH